MYTASVQTLVFLERFSIVVVLRIANCKELPAMPTVNTPNRAALKTSQPGAVLRIDLVDVQDQGCQPMTIN